MNVHKTPTLKVRRTDKSKPMSLRFTGDNDAYKLQRMQRRCFKFDRPIIMLYTYCYGNDVSLKELLVFPRRVSEAEGYSIVLSARHWHWPTYTRQKN